MQNNNGFKKAPFKMNLLKAMLLTTPAISLTTVSYAQVEQQLEEIVVTGTRQIIRDSISIKRNSTTIVDGLSASDIGDLPALSIGEALETITGASSHRENGGATEISIRGLGPFLGATTFNGREATNGSGDRSVNFSQFPSELMERLQVYKTQDASLVEGGVAGLISLDTLKPLDFGRQRIQVNVKGNYNPDQQNISSAQESDIGSRATVSYVNQFQFDSGAEVGISLGFQRSKASQPEAEMRSSSPSGSSRFACLYSPSVAWEGFYRSSSGDCEDQRADAPYDPDGDGDFRENNQGYSTRINPDTGLAYSDGIPFGFAGSSNGYRQNDTSEERDAFFGALQWQPNERWDINLDLQISERVQAENRNDLNFSNQKRATAGVTGPGVVITPKGTVTEWVGDTAIESNSEVYSRVEDYIGGGLAVEFEVNDRLRLSADAAHSQTTREELQISLRLQSDDHDISNNRTPGGYRPRVSWNNYSGIRQYTIEDFDVTDHSLFSDEYRIRIDSDVDRTNTINSLRGDFELDTDYNAITSLEGGLRGSQLEYLNLGGTRYTSPNLDDSSQAERDAIESMNLACRDAAFPESGFLKAVRKGNLITAIDSATGSTTSGTGNGWATFDTRCMANAILAYHGDTFAYPAQSLQNPATTDVTEDTLAAYLMANFEGSFANRPVHGNFGVRVVQTEVESIAYRTEYEILNDSGFLSIQPVPGADFERVSAKDDYTEFLPSLNLVMDLTSDVLLRGGIFRGMSRVDPSDLGYNRSFALNGSEDIIDPADLISAVNGSGNPFTEPLMTWNVDAAIEWYPNSDSMLAVGVYYKDFTGGFEQIRSIETFTVDGAFIQAPVTVSQTSDRTADLYGIEFTGSHRFSYLPGLFSGLGAKISYNYADSDFSFEDSLYGNLAVKELDGSVTPLTRGIIAPGNVPGFSEHVFSGQIYWQIGELDAQLNYKYRSEYFQPYTSNGTRLRFIGDVGVWEARASYQLTDNIKVSLEGINLFDEPKSQYFYTREDIGEVNVYGSRIFFGIQARF